MLFWLRSASACKVAPLRMRKTEKMRKKLPQENGWRFLSASSVAALLPAKYVTSFTAKGGYEYRKDAVPTWVAKADPKNRISGNIDAFTGATPRNGTLHYVWDGKNNEGMPVSKGTYMVFIEGTLYWESRVVFSAKLHWGSCEEESVLVSSRYYGAPSVNKDMITDLKVFHMAK